MNVKDFVFVYDPPTLDRTSEEAYRQRLAQVGPVKFYSPSLVSILRLALKAGPDPKALRKHAFLRALDADEALSEELYRLFGEQAGDARYERRGKSTPELRRLGEKKREADEAWLALLRSDAEAQS